MTCPWWSLSFRPKGVFQFERQKLCHMKSRSSYVRSRWGLDRIRARCSLMAVISLVSSAGYGWERKSPPKSSSGKTDSSSRRWSIAGPSLSTQWRGNKQEDNLVRLKSTCVSIPLPTCSVCAHGFSQLWRTNPLCHLNTFNFRSACKSLHLSDLW